MFKVPEALRITMGRFGTSPTDGNNGAFAVELGKGIRAWVIASDGAGWEHVSVSIHGVPSCPTWDDMCRVKALFWDEMDCVMQLHPPVTEYVNNHAYCLHLWRPTEVDIPLPPSIMVGFTTLGVLK